MSEAEWLAATTPFSGLNFLRWDVQSDRKWRLFCLACCESMARTVPVSDPASLALSNAARFTDGVASVAELAAAEFEPRSSSDIACFYTVYRDDERIAATTAAGYAARAVARLEGVPTGETKNSDAERSARFTRETATQADLLRCIFGNPFRPITFAPSWRSETAISLAAGIYEERAFDRLPILADALEEAGCDHPDVLNHLRGPGPHARGCWVVDGVLGKE
jgi:hypothetical protein